MCITVYLKLDSFCTTLPWIETEDWSSAAAAQRLAEGPVGIEYWEPFASMSLHLGSLAVLGLGSVGRKSGLRRDPCSLSTLVL